VYHPPIVSARSPVWFKTAEDPTEFEQVSRLLYRTFVEEIPSIRPTRSGGTSTAFMTRNLYLIAVSGGAVVGTIALRGTAPFSLDQKLGNVDTLLPEGRRVCELRLLAVEPAFRTGHVFRGLVEASCAKAARAASTWPSFPGTTRQTKLYRHLGFQSFAGLVGDRGGSLSADVHHLRTFPGGSAEDRDRRRAREFPPWPRAHRG
jgi:hypothetical protein